jgi:hypothetical protein
MKMQCHVNMSNLYVPHQMDTFANIDGIHVIGGKVVLIPVVSSNDMNYEMWLAYL